MIPSMQDRHFDLDLLRGIRDQRWVEAAVRRSVNDMSKSKPNRYSISVSGPTYDRLRAAVPHGSVACFVNDMLTTALDDPEILARLVNRCLSVDDGLS